MELSLQPQYVVNKRNSEYYFTIDGSGVDYIAYFIDYSENAGVADIYMFSFEPLRELSREDKKKLGKEVSIKIRNTIVSIIQEFFEQKSRALIFVCDSSDAKECSRNRLFDRWYNHSTFSDTIIKESVVKKGRYYNLLASLLYHKDNFRRTEIQEVLQEFVNLIHEDTE